MSAKILILDIENAPNLALVWKLWDDHVYSDLFLKSNYIMSWSAKWLGEQKVYFDSINQSSKKQMLKGMHKLLDEADIVVHYNGKKHDIPFLNREFLEEDLVPPSPYKEVDLLTVVRNKFKFPSNKLAYVAKALNVGQKKIDSSKQGYSLWVECINGVANSWKKMKEYNVQDVIITEALYLKVRPWIKNHPNVALYEKNAMACPYCASKQFKDAGFAVSKNTVYQQYQCLRSTCKAHFKGTKSLGPVAGKKFSVV